MFGGVQGVGGGVIWISVGSVSNKNVTMEQFWAWAKVYDIDGAGYMFTEPDRLTYSDKELWL